MASLGLHVYMSVMGNEYTVKGFNSDMEIVSSFYWGYS